MNTNQILNYFANSKNFLGVFPCDRLPKTELKNYGFIANTDNHKEKGEHWIAIYVNNNEGQYFDSFGLPPLQEEFFEYLNVNCHKWKFNPCIFQRLMVGIDPGDTWTFETRKRDKYRDTLLHEMVHAYLHLWTPDDYRHHLKEAHGQLFQRWLQIVADKSGQSFNVRVSPRKGSDSPAKIIIKIVPCESESESDSDKENDCNRGIKRKLSFDQ